MTSLADQDVTQLGGRWSILVRQKRDHVRLDTLLDRLPLTEGATQDAVLQQIYRLVFPHAFAEESVLWPELRRRLPDGEALTLQVEREHQEVNELWTALEQLPAVGAARCDVLKRLADVLREDVRDEEDELLPRLQARLDVHRLRALGLAWETVRRIAPTRAHPVVARRPPGNVLAAVPLTVIDRLRDRVDRRIQHGRGPAPRLHDASRLLTRAAHAVEHTPLLRRGEDPSTAAEQP